MRRSTNQSEFDPGPALDRMPAAIGFVRVLPASASGKSGGFRVVFANMPFVYWTGLVVGTTFSTGPADLRGDPDLARLCHRAAGGAQSRSVFQHGSYVRELEATAWPSYPDTVGVMLQEAGASTPTGTEPGAEPEVADLTSNLNEVIIGTDKWGRLKYVSPVATEMLGFTPRELTGQLMDHLILEDDRPIWEARLALAVSGSRETFEVRFRHKQAGPRYLRVSLRKRDPAVRPCILLGTLADVDSERKLDDALTHLALRDPLTKAVSEALFHDRLSLAANLSRRTREQISLMAIALDNLEDVPHRKGTAAGERLLIQVAERLRGLLRKGDTVARSRRDEFYVILPGCRRRGGAAVVGRRIQGALQAPQKVDGTLVTPSVTVGIANLPDDALDADNLLKLALVALSQARQQGRGSFRLYSPVEQKRG